MYPLQGYCEYDKHKYGRSTCDRDERNGWKDACYKSERKEELDKEPYIPVQCVDGSCPMALADEYEERDMDVVHSCEECGYDDKKVIEHDGCETLVSEAVDGGISVRMYVMIYKALKDAEDKEKSE